MQKKVEKQQRAQQDATHKHTQEQQKATERKHAKDNLGEYVDFEEIDE